ncbi:MAG: 4-alpha-glucanotransferase [Chloroflexi bacterium RBG_16_64_43]|nr:MAG: 4-alpha-glucanotransferase [Chloroflexi bacterium RBG_16_64_43]
MDLTRRAGILLHPSSLPGPFGIGDLGPAAEAWVSWLAEARQTLWQVLPLGPTGYGDSPYQALSAFAGNPLLISPDRLVEAGLLTRAELDPMPVVSSQRVQFGQVIDYKRGVLRRAFERYRSLGRSPWRARAEAFLENERHWLDDFAMFAALKADFGGRPWNEWPRDLARRVPQSLADARQRLADEIDRVIFEQVLFRSQWDQLRARVRESGIQVIGDVPLYLAYDSAEVWANPELFRLDSRGAPTHVAGVPPDYFSPTGQRWGNPLYRWARHRADGFAWWQRRGQSAMGLSDWVRIDHFRGLAAYWEVPASSPTAEKGRWVRAPGAALLTALAQHAPRLPLIAEDLGVLTEDVVELRTRFGLPGLRVLQFAFDGDSRNPFLPHNYETATVVFTGTHDNDTARGWYESADESVRDCARRYLGRDGSDMSWDLMRLAWNSVACMALAPLQDVLALGSEARMNFPGRAAGNWDWRFAEGDLTPDLAKRLGELTTLAGRTGAETTSVLPRLY